jgi:hypothetical protein
VSNVACWKTVASITLQTKRRLDVAHSEDVIDNRWRQNLINTWCREYHVNVPYGQDINNIWCVKTRVVSIRDRISLTSSAVKITMPDAGRISLTSNAVKITMPDTCRISLICESLQIPLALDTQNCD